MPPMSAATQSRDGSRTPAGPFRLETQLPYKLFVIAVRVAEMLEDFYGPRYGLSRAAWRVLLTTLSNPGVSARQIGGAVDLDQYAVSRAVTQLVELGFAERSSYPRDKRALSLALTPRGRDVALELTGLLKRVEAALLDGLTPDEASQFKSLLGRVETRSVKLHADRWIALLPPGADVSAPFINFTEVS